jgi:hypothetical protein
MSFGSSRFSWFTADSGFDLLEGWRFSVFPAKRGLKKGKKPGFPTKKGTN